MTQNIERPGVVVVPSMDTDRALFIQAALNAGLGSGDPETLLVSTVLLDTERAFRRAAMAATGALAGGVAAYVIGVLLYNLIGAVVLPMYGQAEHLTLVQGWYQSFGLAIVGAAAFSPLPFSLIALTSGFLGMTLWQFVLAVVLARGARFTLIAWMLWRSGPRAKEWLERNFYGLTMALSMTLLLLAVLVKYIWTTVTMGAGA